MNEHIAPVNITFDAASLIFDILTNPSEEEPFPNANKTVIISANDDTVSIMGTEEELEAIADSILLAVTHNKVARARLEECRKRQQKE